MRVADSSFLIALLVPTDEEHSRGKEWANESGKIMIPTEVLNETLGLLQHRHGFDAARKAKEWLWAQPRFELAFTTSVEFARAWDVFEAQAGRLTLVDATVVAWAQTHRAEVLAFDRALQRAATSR